MAQPKKTKGGSKPLSRKRRRKMERLEKKQRIAGQFVRRKEEKPLTVVNEPTKSTIPSKPPKPSKSTTKTPVPGRVETRTDVAKLHRKRALEAATRQDDAEISKLEKLLRIKKRKKIPSSFKEEGLDCIQYKIK